MKKLPNKKECLKTIYEENTVLNQINELIYKLQSNNMAVPEELRVTLKEKIETIKLYQEILEFHNNPLKDGNIAQTSIRLKWEYLKYLNSKSKNHKQSEALQNLKEVLNSAERINYGR